jgi:hypothetical protein
MNLDLNYLLILNKYLEIHMLSTNLESSNNDIISGA